LLAVSAALLMVTLTVNQTSSALLRTAHSSGSRASLAFSDDLQTTSSSNWSGYAATWGTFSSVVGSWTQPKVACTGQAEYAAFWVGLDGYLSADKNQVEQVGTDSDCSKSKGKKHPGAPFYFAWWDIFPQAYDSFSATSCPVSAGDSMTAEVSYSGGQFTFTISDSTKGWQCTSSQTSSAPARSAEWVVEAPSENGSKKVEPLADFGSINFTGVAANGTQLSSLVSNAITMQVKGTTKATPSALGSDGASFTVTWVHS
jgi:hypothetical protein